MKQLIELVENLKKTEVKKLVDKRINEFQEMGKKENSEIFKELCFCLLTANYDAEKAIRIQNEIGYGFLNLNKNEMALKLKELGYRFPNKRAEYIVEARVHKNAIKLILNSFEDEQQTRLWLADNIKGLGMKEASHFLRNIGYNNLAIIDFHILDILVKYNLAEKPKAVNKIFYLKVESLLKELGKKLNLNMAELDLYLWYSETGKILK
jgi:N-glycosylase/DNA lyase